MCPGILTNIIAFPNKEVVVLKTVLLLWSKLLRKKSLAILYVSFSFSSQFYDIALRRELSNLLSIYQVSSLIGYFKEVANIAILGYPLNRYLSTPHLSL